MRKKKQNNTLTPEKVIKAVLFGQLFLFSCRSVSTNFAEILSGGHSGRLKQIKGGKVPIEN